jgi:glycosyltransferase involved in cell wall biosynthesis
MRILTLVIPTYNRGIVLEKALGIIKPQLEALKDQVEFVISDNCSTDNTQKVVQYYIDSEMPIHYIRNDNNLGAWVNIVNCYKMAQTKYVWVLGDDDYLAENTLAFIINILQDDSRQYGLLFCPFLAADQTGFTVYDDKRGFLSNINFRFCWISGCILSTCYVRAFDFDKYAGKARYDTSALLNICAVRDADYNVIIHEKIFAEVSVAGETNGGYDFMALASDLILLSKDIAAEFEMPGNYAKKFKKNIFKQCISFFIENLFFTKIKSNYNLRGTWPRLFKHYWHSFYFYSFLFYCIIKYTIKRLKNFIFNQKTS